MFGIGMPELILILAVALIVVGPKKLPDLAKSLGRAMNEFKKATSEFKGAMELDYDVKSVKKTFDDVEAELKKSPKSEAEGGKKLFAKNDAALKQKSDAVTASAETAEESGVKEKKNDGASATANTDDTDNDIAGTDIPAELLVNADKPAFGNRVKEKGQAKDGE